MVNRLLEFSPAFSIITALIIALTRRAIAGLLTVTARGIQLRVRIAYIRRRVHRGTGLNIRRRLAPLLPVPAIARIHCSRSAS